jgi:hypothetical protein
MFRMSRTRALEIFYAARERYGKDPHAVFDWRRTREVVRAGLVLIGSKQLNPHKYVSDPCGHRLDSVPTHENPAPHFFCPVGLFGAVLGATSGPIIGAMRDLNTTPRAERYLNRLEEAAFEAWGGAWSDAGATDAEEAEFLRRKAYRAVRAIA